MDREKHCVLSIWESELYSFYTLLLYYILLYHAMYIPLYMILLCLCLYTIYSFIIYICLKATSF